jgi:LEA14-like dessication related protein
MSVRGSALGIAAAVVLSGCGGVGNNFKEPDVRLERVVVRGVGFTGGTLDLVMNVENPNNFSLRGTELALGLDVEGSHVGDVEYKEDYAVNAGGTTTLTLPLRFHWAGVGGAVRAALGYGDLPYKINGQATLRLPFGERVVPFTKEGRAPLTRSGRGLPLPNETDRSDTTR